MSLCKDCITGVTHEGTPEGTYEEIGGVKCYLATPTMEYPKDKVILFLPDAMGYEAPNSQLLADDFARNGFKVVIPDYLYGDPLPMRAFGNPDTTELFAWIAKHSPDTLRECLHKVIPALKEQGVTEFGAIGYCLGGRSAFDLAFDNTVKVVVVNHPSLLKNPDDLEKYASASKAPLLINSCEMDDQFPHEAQAKADELFDNGKFTPGYKREYWAGCRHGFAVRGDMSNPKVKAGKEGAYKGAVEWFIKYL